MGITRSLVAAKARKASTRTIGDIFVQLILTIINPTAGSTDRVLDGPTNLVWIDPWLAYLESRGVRYVKGAQIEEILCQNGRITGVAVSQQGKRAVATGDYYIAALPVERIAPLVSAGMLAADPDARQLARARRECGVDERRPVLSAPQSADHARARDSHRYGMGPDEHLAAPVLA